MFELIISLLSAFFVLCWLERKLIQKQIQYLMLKVNEFPSPARAQDLAQRCLELMSGEHQSGSKLNLPQYRFYTELMEQLMMNHLKHGAPIKKYLGKLRASLLRSALFDKELLGTIWSSFMQMGFSAAMVWGFYLLAQDWFQLSIELSMIVGLALFQIVGVSVFVYLVIFLHQRTFKDPMSLLKTAYLLHSLTQCSLPLSFILQSNQHREVVNKKYTQYLEELERIINTRLKKGMGCSELIQDYMDNLWLELSMGKERYHSQLNMLKFSILCTVFLPSYFMTVSMLFNQLL
jgi:hypothetical protein